VLAICKHIEADIYINPIGGLELYNKERFREHTLELQFQKANYITYNQFNNEFVPWLSIIDIMMFNNKDEITSCLNNYTIV
jgi:hypothetical protein